jgi:hypothetical protein
MKKAMIMIMCILLLGGCGAGELNSSTAPSDKEGSNAAIPNDIPHQLKDVDKEKLDSAIQYWSKSYLNLLDSAFFKNRNHESFQQTSHRLYRPGEQFEIDADSLSRDGRYEVRFLQFNEEDKNFKTLLEETVYRDDPDFIIDIPEQENVTYYIEQIALNSKNEVLKQEYHRVFVPYNDVNGRIDTDKAVYSSGETMKVTLKNLGTVEIGTGYGVGFEKWNGKQWRNYEFEQMVPEPLIILRTGQSFSEDVKLKGFKKGTYRVVEGLADGHNVSSIFTVE